ncbi:DUF2931 family protein [Dyella caseinilytica]|uniref:DUF2931 family protein n=2 Tax=Dyella caseinilytica TaxID=1849581 RepID=A0ABX7GQP2_9GAMM|nr:DUF2931 family protein [Dyella caseinilytica]QRN52744.1 DUF2931 family protein [Dyella caseinilytica]
MKYLCCLWLLFLTSCSSAGGPLKRELPYDAWYLGFEAPSYMEVWLERVDVEDVHGLYFANIWRGTVAMGYEGDPAGWSEGLGVVMGKGRYITGAALPKRIFVRWQSLAEPQTYRVTLEIPESARQQMLKKAPYVSYPDQLKYQDVLAIELSPGGWAKAWVMNEASMPVEILCQKAEVEPKGPDQGLSDGRYAYALNKLHPETQEYLKTHPIPFNSWKCPEQTSVLQ